MPLTLVTAPDGAAVLATDIKTQSRVEIDDEDEWLETFVVPAVHQRAQDATRRQLLSATRDLIMDGFPCWNVIEMPRPPLLTVVFIKYVDTAGTLQTWAADQYLVQAVEAPIEPRCRRGRITPAYGVSWPSTRPQMGAVTIRFTCGYGAEAEDVPILLRKAMLMDARGLVERGDAEPKGSAGLIYWRYRSWAKYPIPGIE